MFSVLFDHEADVVIVDLKPDVLIETSIPIGDALLANYDVRGDLVSVEVLYAGAILEPDVAKALQGLLGGLARSLTAPKPMLSSSGRVSAHFATQADALAHARDLLSSADSPQAAGHEGHLVQV